ncbi:MAG: hypothetical protein NTX03_13940 [Bacteroidetes bacterium]|nr:hypothetical protein [Bacteroidota bacterium]
MRLQLMLNRLAFSSLLLLIFSGCSSAPKEKEERTQEAPAKDDFKTKTIIEVVKCKQDSTQSYALYLPEKYSANSPLPVVFFFDPHAQGANPLRKYKALAEEFNFILVCSNNSQNGMDMDEVSRIGKTMMDDAISRLSVIPSQIYCAGFSGGARVAVQVTNEDNRVAGVIGCGAGFPEKMSQLNHKFSYIGFVGDGDFNYSSMIVLEAALQNSGPPFQFVYFNGKHAWAPLEFMREGFIWLQVNTIKEGRKIDDYFITDFVKTNLLRADTAHQKGDVWQEYLTLKKIENFTKGIAENKEVATRLSTIQNSDALKKAISQNAENTKKENEIIRRYMQYMDADISWWKNEISQTKIKAKTANTTAEVGIYKRILANISIISYSKTNQALQSNALADAEKFVTIFRLVDDGNPDVDYLNAILEAKKGNSDMAINHLKAAIKNGFTDKQKLLKESAFEKLKTSKQFIDLVNGMQ